MGPDETSPPLGPQKGWGACPVPRYGAGIQRRVIGVVALGATLAAVYSHPDTNPLRLRSPRRYPSSMKNAVNGINPIAHFGLFAVSDDARVARIGERCSDGLVTGDSFLVKIISNRTLKLSWVVVDRQKVARWMQVSVGLH